MPLPFQRSTHGQFFGNLVPASPTLCPHRFPYDPCRFSRSGETRYLFGAARSPSATSDRYNRHSIHVLVSHSSFASREASPFLHIPPLFALVSASGFLLLCPFLPVLLFTRYTHSSNHSQDGSPPTIHRRRKPLASSHAALTGRTILCSFSILISRQFHQATGKICSRQLPVGIDFGP